MCVIRKRLGNTGWWRIKSGRGGFPADNLQVFGWDILVPLVRCLMRAREHLQLDRGICYPFRPRKCGIGS